MNFTEYERLQGDNKCKWWIAKVTSSLHDLLPVSQKPCKTNFRENSATIEKPEVNFTNIAQTGIYSYKGFEYCQRMC